MDVVLLLARLLLGATFALAGVTKLTDPEGTRRSIVDFGAPAFLARPVAWALPLAELVCAVALIPAATSLYGAAGTLALLLIFIGVIAASLARGRRPDCHCFGQLHSEPVGLITLARNIALSGVAGAVILAARDNRTPSYAGWLSSLSRFDTAVLVFSAALAGMAALWIWSLMHLLRQNGRLMARLEAVEAHLGMPQEPPAPGLPLDTPAPAFSLAALDGSIVTLDTLRRENETILLIFNDLGCGPCDALMPRVADWQSRYADRLMIVLIGSGDLAANRAKASEHGLRNFLLQVNGETAKAYQAEGTPTAVLIRNGKMASLIASGADAIIALVEKAALPPPLPIGELAPDLVLPDLKGEPVGFRGLLGRRHLLLFWNPDCGFCQEMIADLKAWEHDPPDDAPRLLFVSTGTPETNRAQGFRAPILLDQNFQTGKLFGAAGTPAAVLLDEDGRVASNVGVGAAEVLSLAGKARTKLVQPV